MRKLLVFLAAFAVAIALTVPAEAQFARAGLTGRVIDPDGAALPGVTVMIRNQDSGFTRTTVTSSTGGYVFSGLTPGTYTVTFSLQGFQTVERPDVVLRVGTTPELNISMTLGSVQETVTVTAQTPLVETTSKEVGGEITTQEFNDLPSQNRSFVMFARLLPGVNASPDTESTSSDSLFINGQDDNNNSFNVDGANNDDDVIGARAGAQTRTALDAIQELQILTTQFDAEFGRTQGGVINAVTKSGGNDFHGSGFLFLQDSSWNSKNFFTERNNQPQPDADYRSVGGTLGGPIKENVAHFFASFERNTPNEAVANSFASRPDLSFTTAEENLVRNWLFKGDWQASSSHKVSVRYLREYSPQFNQIVSSRDTLENRREEDDTDQNVIGTLDSVVSDTGFNNLRISFTQEDVAFANPCYNQNGQDFAAQRGCDVQITHDTYDLGTNTVAQDRVNNSYQLDDTFSLYVPDWQGDHDMRFGVNYSRRQQESNFNDTANGTFDIPTDRPFDPNDITTYPDDFNIRAFGSLTATIPDNNVIGLFYQDDWQPIANLTLNLGVRWDKEDAIPNDDNNIGPRFGFSWDPVGDGRTVVRGGWGRFYERFQMGTFNNIYLDAVTQTQGFIVRIPTAGNNQQYFFDFAQANGITDLNALRDALAAMIEATSESIINPNPTVDNPDRTGAYADTLTVGVEREVFEGISVGADVVRTENKNTVLAVNLNPAGGANPATGSGARRPDISILDGVVDPRIDSITSWINAGETTYTALQLQVEKRMSRTPIGPLSGRFSYTAARQEGNVDAAISGTAFQVRTESGFNFDTGEFIGAALDPGLDHPSNVDRPSGWHRPHILATSWTWQVPGTSWQDNGGLILTGIYEWRSGDRVTLTGETFLDNGTRVILPAGTYAPNASSDIALDPMEFEGKINGGENPDFSRLDMSFRYRIPVQSFGQATVMADFFNLTDTVNFSNIGSSRALTSSSFLIPSSARQPREFQFGVRFEF